MTASSLWYTDLLQSRGATPPDGLLSVLRQAIHERFEPRAGAIVEAIAAGFDTPHVLSRFLLAHSESERAGGHVIGAVAGRPEAEPFRDVLIAHAVDEERHDRMLEALSRQVDPGAPEARPDHQAENEAFLDAYDGDLANFVCDVHVAEIRSYYFLAAYIQAAGRSSARYAPKIKACFEEILRDEENHISYTAALIGRWHAADPGLEQSIRRAAGLYATLIDRKLDGLRAIAAQEGVQA